MILVFKREIIIVVVFSVRTRLLWSLAPDISAECDTLLFNREKENRQ